MPLCETQLKIIIILLVIRLSATEDVKNLSGTVGGNITLPDPVLEFGFLLYGRKTVAMVNERKSKILEETYTDRVHWNRNTGLFTLTDLQRKDSGIYSIDSKTGKIIFKSYNLTVYDPVPTPRVKRLNIISDSCFFLCSVDKETTLLWYKDEEILNQSSSALSLPLLVYKQDFNSSYKCVAANPAENKTQPVDVKTTCGQDDTDSSRDENPRHYPVPTPRVTILSNISDSCFLLCSVDNRTTLLWYKDEEILDQTSSALSLPLLVYKQDFNSSYKCVAANPAENKTQPVNVKTTCGQDDTDSSRDENPRHYMIGIGVGISILCCLGVLFAVPMIKRKFFDQNKRPNGQD